MYKRQEVLISEDLLQHRPRQLLDWRCRGVLESVLDQLAPRPDIDEVQEFGAGAGIVCLLYTSDAADERSSVDLGGRRII